MRFVETLYISVAFIIIVSIGANAFLGGIVKLKGVSDPDIGVLNESQLLFEETRQISDETAAIAVDSVDDDNRANSYIGGSFKVSQLTQGSSNILRRVLTTISTMIFANEVLTFVIGIFMAVIGVKLAISILNWIRGIPG